MRCTGFVSKQLTAQAVPTAKTVAKTSPRLGVWQRPARFAVLPVNNDSSAASNEQYHP
jgi:hypothetical protein